MLPLKVALLHHKLFKCRVVECNSGSITSLEQGQLLVSFGSEKFGISVGHPQHLPVLRPEVEVNISDFEAYILVQNGGSSGAGRLGVFAPRSAFGQQQQQRT